MPGKKEGGASKKSVDQSLEALKSKIASVIRFSKDTGTLEPRWHDTANRIDGALAEMIAKYKKIDNNNEPNKDILLEKLYAEQKAFIEASIHQLEALNEKMSTKADKRIGGLLIQQLKKTKERIESADLNSIDITTPSIQVTPPSQEPLGKTATTTNKNEKSSTQIPSTESTSPVPRTPPSAVEIAAESMKASIGPAASKPNPPNPVVTGAPKAVPNKENLEILLGKMTSTLSLGDEVRASVINGTENTPGLQARIEFSPSRGVELEALKMTLDENKIKYIVKYKGDNAVNPLLVVQASTNPEISVGSNFEDTYQKNLIVAKKELNLKMLNFKIKQTLGDHVVTSVSKGTDSTPGMHAKIEFAFKDDKFEAFKKTLEEKKIKYTEKHDGGHHLFLIEDSQNPKLSAGADFNDVYQKNLKLQKSLETKNVVSLSQQSKPPMNSFTHHKQVSQQNSGADISEKGKGIVPVDKWKEIVKKVGPVKDKNNVDGNIVFTGKEGKTAVQNSENGVVVFTTKIGIRTVEDLKEMADKFVITASVTGTKECVVGAGFTKKEADFLSKELLKHNIKSIMPDKFQEDVKEAARKKPSQ